MKPSEAQTKTICRKERGDMIWTTKAASQRHASSTSSKVKENKVREGGSPRYFFLFPDSISSLAGGERRHLTLDIGEGGQGPITCLEHAVQKMIQTAGFCRGANMLSPWMIGMIYSIWYIFIKPPVMNQSTLNVNKSSKCQKRISQCLSEWLQSSVWGLVRHFHRARPICDLISPRDRLISYLPTVHIIRWFVYKYLPIGWHRSSLLRSSLPEVSKLHNILFGPPRSHREWKDRCLDR